MARILAKAINCTDLRDGEPCDACPACIAIREGRALDVVEMDAASNNRVDDMRDLLGRVMTAPSDLRRKVYVVDEVQRIRDGWDVLLRTLEEPPPHVVFIFCTTDPSKIRPAVLSRLQRFDFRPIARADIAAKLEAKRRKCTGGSFFNRATTINRTRKHAMINRVRRQNSGSILMRQNKIGKQALRKIGCFHRFCKTFTDQKCLRGMFENNGISRNQGRND